MPVAFDDEEWKTEDEADEEDEEDWEPEGDEDDDEGASDGVSSMPSSGGDEESEDQEEESEEEEEEFGQDDFDEEDEEEQSSGDEAESFADEGGDVEQPEVFAPTPLTAEEEEENLRKFKKSITVCCLCCICLAVVGGAIVLGVMMTAGQGGQGDDLSTQTPLTPSSPTTEPVATPSIPSPSFALPTYPPGYIPPSVLRPPTSQPTNSSMPTEEPTPSPTQAPSRFPTMSPSLSMAPTRAVPDELFLTPDADTYIYSNGFTSGEAYGKEKTMLVQNGPKGVNEVADAFILMTFDLELLPAPWRIAQRQNTAILRLNHVVREDAATQSPSNYTVVRLPPTPLAVETLHGNLFVPFDGITGPTFEVKPFDTKVEVDVTSLLFGQPPFAPAVRHDRHLQDELSQLFLMIQAQGPEQPIGGDRFNTRESDAPPELYIQLKKTTAGPDPVRPPPTAPPPTAPPSTSNPIIAFEPGFNPESSPSPIQVRL